MIIKTFSVMAMPCTITIADRKSKKKIETAIGEVHRRLKKIDETYSPFKKSSIISCFNRKELSESNLPIEVKNIFILAEETKKISNGYFDIKKPDGQIDPCGIVKGWAIHEASRMLKDFGFKNFMVEIAGDIQTSGFSENGPKWSIGIRNPFILDEVIKVIKLSGQGIATSGIYMQGEHIYNPKKNKPANEVISLTVVGPNVYEADRFATAAFAMGKFGIEFIEKRRGLEGYSIDHSSVATFTSGFLKYCNND